MVICMSQITYAQNANANYQLLWEVSKGSGPKSYVFGSLHSNDKRLFNLPDSAYIALMATPTIVLETDVFSMFETMDTRLGVVEMQFDNKGNPYTELDIATETTYGDEDGMPQFLDAYLQQFCHNAGKEFIPLESIEFQLGLFDEVDYLPSLRDFDFKSLLSSKEDMVDIYLKGNIGELNDFVKSGLSLMPDMYETLIVERNYGMVQKLDSMMQSKPLFCAVGAGHLAGPTGILSLLQNEGYTVRKVLATYDDIPTEAEGKFKSYRNFEVKDEKNGLHMFFPGKPLHTFSEDETYLERWIYRDLGQGNSYEVLMYERGDTDSWSDAAASYLPSPQESRYENIRLDNGGEAIQGLGQEYLDPSLSWIRIIMTEDLVYVLKASGGNKFMNSPRAFRFFDQVHID